MILGYTLPRAETLIIRGIKIHTVRSDPKKRWRAGMRIHHSTGVRTKKYNCFLNNECKALQRIFFIYLGTGKIICNIDRRRLTDDELLQFAINDGFEDVAGLVAWFFPVTYNSSIWAGTLIHWTDKKY